MGLKNVASCYDLKLNDIELNSCGLIKFKLPLKRLHDRMRSDCLHAQTYRSLSATGDRAEDSKQLRDHALKHAQTLWSDANAEHLMPTPTCLLREAPLNIQMARSEVFDSGSDVLPVFISDFDVLKYNQAIQQHYEFLNLSRERRTDADEHLSPPRSE